jgi:ATP-binding cassette subfamily B protein
LVENMAAHRTRVSQQYSAHWHRADDATLTGYVPASRRLDRYNAFILSVLPRGYILVATFALLPSFIAGRTTLGQLATILGAVLFAAAAWQRLCGAFIRGAAAWSSWRVVEPLFAAGVREPSAAHAKAVAGARRALDVRELSYQHPRMRDAVLKGVTFSVAQGERILLEGASGSGKSTLAAILAGSKQATGGYVLAAGLDRQTVGEAQWTRHVALAPQYHENHIISGTLLFNVALARPLPHKMADIEEAAAVCAELGLSDLIARMPAGLNQIVGDTGWRLSQGERSRIFLARALLQRADVVVLDESLGALDPENLGQCLQCIMRRASALILIAHP